MDIETLLQQSNIKTRAELARICGRSKPAVGNWSVVPEDCCPAVESHTGIRCEELRPDREWKRARGRIIGYTVPVAS